MAETSGANPLPGRYAAFCFNAALAVNKGRHQLAEGIIDGVQGLHTQGGGGALLKKAVAPFFWFVSAKAPLLGHPEMGRPVGAGTSGRLPKTAAAPSQLPPGHRRGCTADDALGGTPLLRPGFAC
jgi:hypothetical protein